MKESKDFKQLLEKYRWGHITDEEKAYVEQELEKVEAIQEYLFESGELPPLPDQLPEQRESSTEAVRKIVRRKWLKHGIVTGGIIFLILLGGWSFGRPLLNKLYFDPTQGRTEKTYSDYELYKKVENNLSATSDALEDIQIEQTGIGSYVLRSTYYNALKDETNAYATVLKRDRIETQPASGVLEKPWYAYQTVSTMEMFGNQHNKELEELKEKIGLLPKTAIMKVNLYFDYYNQMSLADLKSLVVSEHQLDYLLTVGIASSSYDSMGLSTFGIRFNGSHLSYSYHDGRYDRNMAQINQLNEEYPYLMPRGQMSINSDPEKLEQHYFSMLDYLLDNKELGEEIEKVFSPEIYAAQSAEAEEGVESPSEWQTYNQLLKEAKSFAKENGVNVTQATLLLTPEEFKKLLGDERIATVGVAGVELMDSRIW